MKKRRPRRNHYFRPKTGGIVFVSGVMFVLVSAWNTGNNLLYLIFGMMLSLLGVALAFPRITLNRLSVEQTFPHTVHAGESADLVIRVRNGKKVFHSFSLEVNANSRNGNSGGYILKVSPGETATIVAHRTFYKRGRYYLEPARVSTSYPFGFFEQGVLYGREREVLVYPQLKRLKDSVIERVLGYGEIVPHGGRGPGTEYYSLREYSHGDDARLISWKVSAKQGKLMLREFEKPERKALLIVFDTDSTEYGDSSFGELFEEAVKFCASLALHCINDGYDVELITPDKSPGFGSGERHLHGILSCLALIVPSRGERGKVLSQLREIGKDMVSVIVTPDKDRFAGYQRAGRVSVVQYDEIEFK